MMQQLHKGSVALFFLCMLTFFVSCNSGFTPKPKGYFKIDLPKRFYQPFDEAGFPYRFEYPAYATVSKEVDTTGHTIPIGSTLSSRISRVGSTSVISRLQEGLFTK